MGATTSEKKIKDRLRIRKVVLTYNLLPINIDANLDLLPEILRMHKELSQQQFPKCINRFTIQKEYYAEDNEHSKEHCHLHGYVSLDKAVRIRNINNFASSFIIRHEDKEYYPNIQKTLSEHSYLEYIAKTHKLDERYSSPKYYLDCELNPKEHTEEYKIEQLNKTLVRCTLERTPKHIAFEMLNKEFEPRFLQKYKKNIDFYLSKFIVNNYNYNTNLNIEFDEKTLEYFSKDYIGGMKENMFIYIKELIKKKIEIPSKSSLYIYGHANTMKSSMTKAACVSILQEDVDNKYLLLCIYDIEDLKELIDKQEYLKSFKHVIIILDDIDIKPEYTRSQILQILQGNKGVSHTTIPCRFSNIVLPNNVIKIFLHNGSFDQFVKQAKEEMKARIEIIDLGCLFKKRQ